MEAGPGESNNEHPTRPSVSQLATLYRLERVSGFGPVKFRSLREAGVDPLTVLNCPEKLPLEGRTADKLRAKIDALPATDEYVCEQQAKEQIERAEACGASILTYENPQYPQRVYSSNNPIPVLYVRGNPSVWESCPAVALVGSRNIREPYSSSAETFAIAAAESGVLVVSGFALGADSIAHQTALAAGGKTVCVMPCGLEYVFPPENFELWESMLADSRAAFVSEFRFGIRASSLALRKRNKLIVAFVQGVLVAQSADNGGAMNAYRSAREQRKHLATFTGDGSEETTGNVVIGCDSRVGRFGLEPSLEKTEYIEWLQKLPCWN